MNKSLVLSLKKVVFGLFAAALAQYEVKATTYKNLGEDKETKVVSCVF